MISKKHKYIDKCFSYTEHLLILASTVTGCVSISAFAFLFGIPAGLPNSTAAIKTWVITAWFEKYKSIIKKKKKKRL